MKKSNCMIPPPRPKTTPTRDGPVILPSHHLEILEKQATMWRRQPLRPMQGEYKTGSRTAFRRKAVGRQTESCCSSGFWD